MNEWMYGNKLWDGYQTPEKYELQFTFLLFYAVYFKSLLKKNVEMLYVYCLWIKECTFPPVPDLLDTC